MDNPVEKVSDPMIVYPAIDLLGGQCVRLSQGQYNAAKVYDTDPLRIAMQFKEAGALWLHVVDLDAARSGVPANEAIIAQIHHVTGLKIQTGGGIRNMTHLRHLLEDVGLERAILGTAAIRDPRFTKDALQRYPDRIAIGIDARDGEISIDGWTQGSGVSVLDFAQKMAGTGARIAIFTDIRRDGMLVGPAIDQVRLLVEKSGMGIIASGGIGSVADIEAIRGIGASGVIVGKAIYEGKVRLDQCWPRE